MGYSLVSASEWSSPPPGLELALMVGAMQSWVPQCLNGDMENYCTARATR